LLCTGKEKKNERKYFSVKIKIVEKQKKNKNKHTDLLLTLRNSERNSA